MHENYLYDPDFLPIPDMLFGMTFHDLVAKRAGMLIQAQQANAAVSADDINVSDAHVNAKNQTHSIPVRIYTPKNISALTPALIYVHGGGFVLGGIETSHIQCLGLARDLQVIVICVGYRLAPETSYPGPLEDCRQVFEWAIAESARLMVDITRLGVMGESAGANLVASLCLYLRDTKNSVQPCVQLLGVPVLDDRLTSHSMQRFDDTPLLSCENIAQAWDHYLGDLTRGTKNVPYYAAPARAPTLEGLPRTYISVMEFDPLRDEGLAYAQRLLTCGVKTEIHCYPGTFHGSSLFFPQAAVSQRERSELLVVIKNWLSNEE